MNKQEYADYTAAVNDFFQKESIANLSTGLCQCPDCQVDFECQQCPQCGKDAYEFANEPFYSHNPCQCCRTTLAGMREDAHGFCPDDHIVKNFVVCEDCVYFAEYGELDDNTMLEIEKEG